MTSDLRITPERLRALADRHPHTFAVAPDLIYAVADQIVELRAALEPFAALHRERTKWGSRDDVPDEQDVWGFDEALLTHGDFRRAAAALRVAPDDQ